MNINSNRTFILVLSLLMLTLVLSCSGKIGDRPSFPDPEFSGLWVGGSVDLLIAHDEGMITAVGFNNSQNATWDSLSFTGGLDANGLAQGIVQIWGVNIVNGQEHTVMIAEFILDFLRAGNTITLNLIPLQETYVLQKQ